MIEYDVVGIGNALIDVLAHIEDEYLKEYSLDKGAMTLVDIEEVKKLYATMKSINKFSGGSCGNTMAGFASLGGKGAFIGKVRDDKFGCIFRKDLQSLGVDFLTPPAVNGPPTGSCFVLITPDAQRTMCTYLGAATYLTSADINENLIRSAKVVYMEGYLFDPLEAQSAFVKAAGLAHEAGCKVSVTLSDAFCVDRHREAFKNLVREHTDILFGNGEEIKSLYQVNDLDTALQIVRQHCKIACVTLGSKGSVIVSGDQTEIMEPEPTEQVIDTTGAGDQYAAGFLYGYTQGMCLKRCGKIATLAATEVISHVGARPEVDLSDLVVPNLD